MIFWHIFIKMLINLFNFLLVLDLTGMMLKWRHQDCNTLWCCYADQELKIVGINFELSLFHGGFYVIIHKTTELKNLNPFERYCGLHVNYRTWELKSIWKTLWIMCDYPQNYRTWELKAIESYVNCGILFDYKQDL